MPGKEFLLIPISAASHWSLALVLMPSRQSDCIRVLHLDSLPLSRSGHAMSLLHPLRELFLRMGCGDVEFVKANPPRQPNQCDCGLYMLLCIKYFLQQLRLTPGVGSV